MKFPISRTDFALDCTGIKKLGMRWFLNAEEDDLMVLAVEEQF